MNLMKLLSNTAISEFLNNVVIKNNEIIIDSDLTIKINGTLKIISDEDLILYTHGNDGKSNGVLHFNPSFDEKGQPIIDSINDFDYTVNITEKYKRRTKCACGDNH